MQFIEQMVAPGQSIAVVVFGEVTPNSSCTPSSSRGGVDEEVLDQIPLMKYFVPLNLEQSAVRASQWSMNLLVNIKSKQLINLAYCESSRKERAVAIAVVFHL